MEVPDPKMRVQNSRSQTPEVKISLNFTYTGSKFTQTGLFYGSKNFTYIGSQYTKDGQL